jgi:hypothetical protein
MWRATVPVFRDALDRIEGMLLRAQAALGPAVDAALAGRPAPGMLPAGRQVATAAQFTLRIAFPLAGARAPELRDPLDTVAGLGARLAGSRALLDELDPVAFAGAETRMVRAQAGFADLEMPGEAFLYRFGLPSFYFHQAVAYVALKQAGAPLGKADFDGLHDYPDGFSLG